MKVNDLLTILDGASKLNVTTFEYEEGGSRIAVSFGSGKDASSHESTLDLGAKTSPQEVFSQEEGVEEETAVSGNVVKSPLVGTFYAAPAEDGEPFVKVGDKVTKGQQVAIVEAMKLMNEITCGFDGEVARVLVENGQMVEFGQPLFEII